MLNDHSIAACADYRVSYRCLHSYAAQIVMFSPQAVMQPAARNAFAARLVGSQSVLFSPQAFSLQRATP